MASNSIHPGHAGPVRNYLGNPCSIAPLLAARADESQLDDYKNPDIRHLVQLLGKALAKNESRLQNALTAAEELEKMASNCADHLDIESMVDVLRDYLLHTQNHAFETTTMVLAALHRTGLIVPAQSETAEVAHG